MQNLLRVTLHLLSFQIVFGKFNVCAAAADAVFSFARHLYIFFLCWCVYTKYENPSTLSCAHVLCVCVCKIYFFLSLSLVCCKPNFLIFRFLKNNAQNARTLCQFRFSAEPKRRERARRLATKSRKY